MGHELWCKNSKLCFNMQMESVISLDSETDEGVLLQLMKIPPMDSDRDHEVVLWDSACSGFFVRDAHARKMNFPYWEKRLRVTTLGGQIQEIDGVIYRCQIKDQKGKILEFYAHGLEEVTGSVGRPIAREALKQMFPDIMGTHRLTGATTVDYLIGLGKASWQPQRVK